MSETAPRPQASRGMRSATNNARQYDPLDLDKLLARQKQVLTRSQALGCGFSEGAIHRRLSGGRHWQRLLPGVYLTVTGTPTADQRDMAALLYAGPGGTLTGAAAMRRHGLHTLRSDNVDVLVPAERRRQSVGFVVVQHTSMLPEYVCYIGPIQYALVARAVADAARQLRDLVTVRAVVAAAVQTRKCTVEQLATEYRSGPIRGSALLRAALAEVVQGARSAPEADIMTLINSAQLPTPLFNAQLFVGKELLAVPDVWWPGVGLVVEVDSKEWHLTPAGWEATMVRHAKLTALGLLVLHFTPRQIREEPEQVLDVIRRALASRHGEFVTNIRTVPAEA